MCLFVCVSVGVYVATVCMYSTYVYVCICHCVYVCVYMRECM